MAKPSSTLTGKIATLGDLDRTSLVDHWTRIYGCPPPSGVRQPFLIRAIAFDLQQKQLGGYCAATRRLLNAAMQKARPDGGEVLRDVVASDVSVNGTASSNQGHMNGLTADGDAAQTALPAATVAKCATPPRKQLSPGARLMREWNGRTHIVDVTKDGFRFDGKTYRSLSAIAGTITGANWSGPRFFGL